MFLEMSLCFMAYCAAIKHLLGRQLICQACLLLLFFFFFIFSLTQRSDSLKVLFTNLCLLLRDEDESENHSPACKCLKCACVRLIALDNVRFLSFTEVRVFSVWK